jgi:hypothetical protein
MDNSKSFLANDSLHTSQLPNYDEIEHRPHDRYFLLRIILLFLLHIVHFIADVLFIVGIGLLGMGGLYFTLTTTYRLFNVMMCVKCNKDNLNSAKRYTSVFLSFFDVGLARMVSKQKNMFGVETAYIILCIVPQMAMNIVSIFTEYNIKIVGWATDGNHFYETGYSMRPIGTICLFFKAICILNYVLFLNKFKVFKLSTVNRFLRDLSE